MPDASSAALSVLADIPGVRVIEHADGRSKAFAEDVLPVLPAFRDLFPDKGLRRGTSIAVHDSVSLLLSLLVEISKKGSWIAVLGMSDLGISAATEWGIELERLVLIPDPGHEAASVTATLLDGMDVVVIESKTFNKNLHFVRKISARARQRKSIVVAYGAWPGSHLDISAHTKVYYGLKNGAGFIDAQRIVVKVIGKGAAAHPRRKNVLISRNRIVDECSVVALHREAAG